MLNSYWLLYIVYSIPLIALGAMVAMVIFLAYNWKFLSDALGFGFAAKRRSKKKSSTVQMVVWMGFWFLAIGVLFWKCGGIFCNAGNSTQTLTQSVTNQVTPSGPLPNIPLLVGANLGLGSIIGSEWFAVAFLGLLVVSSVILVRSVMVSMGETRNANLEVARVREEGGVAVREALRVLEDEEAADPRTRIMACYLRMIRAAADLGAPIGSDQTARELEAGIRGMFMLKGTSIKELTQLFEEARYSLHSITEEDADEAHRCLVEIGQELETAISVQA